ncbi:hypothetical protein Hanom_Chr09g00841301 [Helianthus anomalus]
MWRARNQCLFSNEPIKIQSILGEIKYYSFLWISNRSRNLSLEWTKWKRFNV